MLILSIILEGAVAVLAFMVARKRKPYLYGLAFTFAVYVLYDVARVFGLDVREGFLSLLFLFAAVGALIAVWGLYQETQG
jgi:hypothetical protein